MSTRRSFLRMGATGLAALGIGMCRLIARPADAGRRFLMESPPGTETVINGKRYLYFGGTSYWTVPSSPGLLPLLEGYSSCSSLS